MAAKVRPHSIVGRLTAPQYELLKDRIEREQHMTIQKLIAAAVNAYIRGDFEILKDGSYRIGEAGVITEGFDADALDLDDLEPDDPFEGPVRSWGTSELVDYCERTTGRRVSKQLLRQLLRDEYPTDQPPGPGRRYRWDTDDPQLHEIIERIGGGVLDEIRERRIGAYRK